MRKYQRLGVFLKLGLYLMMLHNFYNSTLISVIYEGASTNASAQMLLVNLFFIAIVELGLMGVASDYVHDIGIYQVIRFRKSHIIITRIVKKVCLYVFTIEVTQLAVALVQSYLVTEFHHFTIDWRGLLLQTLSIMTLCLIQMFLELHFDERIGIISGLILFTVLVYLGNISLTSDQHSWVNLLNLTTLQMQARLRLVAANVWIFPLMMVTVMMILIIVIALLSVRKHDWL